MYLLPLYRLLARRGHSRNTIHWNVHHTRNLVSDGSTEPEARGWTVQTTSHDTLTRRQASRRLCDGARTPERGVCTQTVARVETPRERWMLSGNSKVLNNNGLARTKASWMALSSWLHFSTELTFLTINVFQIIRYFLPYHCSFFSVDNCRYSRYSIC